MEPLLQALERSTRPDLGSTVEVTVLCLLLAFVLGQVIAWTYAATHSGLSYSRTFTQSLVLLTLIVSLVMLVIGNNIVTAFGLIGALAIIRFRNVLKDTRDTSFVFLSLVIGMAVGSERFLTAIIGTAGLVLVVPYMHYTAFGSGGRFDGHLSFLVTGTPEGDGHDAVLARFCRTLRRISVREAGLGEEREYVFQVRLRDRERSQELLGELRQSPGISNVALVIRDELAEI